MQTDTSDIYDIIDPILPELKTVMDFDVAVGQDGPLYVFYSKPLDEPVEWLEYNRENRTLALITVSGRMQTLGLKIPPQIDAAIPQSGSAFMIRVDENGQKRDIRKVVIHTAQSLS
ncbi:MAG: hypothetical protein H6861_09320 [Rhodospirillales bacterium]|nr:hypothetical protein [Rhodospirillales bacterium]